MHIGLNAQLLDFTPTYRSGGISRYIYHLLVALRELDGPERFTAFVSQLPADPALAPTSRFRLHAVGLPTRRPPVRIFWEQCLQPAALRRAGVDLLHALAFALPLCWRGPAVVSFMDLSFLRYPRAFNRANRVYLATMARAAVRRADHLLAISESTRQDLIHLLGATPGRVTVTYCGVDPAFRPLAGAEVAAFRARYGLPPGYILYVGTLEPRKNVPRLLDAYAVLRRLRGGAPPLVLVGARGWRRVGIEARVARLGLEGQVRWLGYLPPPELPLCYNAAGLFVYPSLYEGFGLPPLEALACGTPVVTANTSSLPEAVGDAALTVDPHDVAALAEAMARVLDDCGLRARLRAAGPAWASRFTWRQTAEQTRGVYRRLGSRGSA
ncbi:MAG TPA: glycosyltransferase family 1 protein [Chloroflexota bacterium]|nr:glycosyltransferase family 1 protein [Chloroflexota bacterium]